MTLKETAVVEREKAERVSAEKLTLMNSHQTQINELNKQIGILQGTLQANDTKLKEYTDILQGRSPEQAQFMEFMIKSTKENSECIKFSTDILRQIQVEINTLKEKV